MTNRENAGALSLGVAAIGCACRGGAAASPSGHPQGGVASPLLANIYLDRLDQAWQADHWRLGELTRYADDLAIVCATRQQAVAALDVLRHLLCELGLELAAAKTRVVDMRTPAEGFDFLGYHFRVVPTRRNPRRKFAACWPSRSAVAAARDRIRALTPLERVGLPTIMVVQDLNRFLRGWGAYCVPRGHARFVREEVRLVA